MAFKHPEKRKVERNRELVRLLEAPALAIEAANDARGPAIPDRIQERIDRHHVAVYNGKRKAQGAAQKRAEQYVQNAQWEVNYEQESDPAVHELAPNSSTPPGNSFIEVSMCTWPALCSGGFVSTTGSAGITE
ncbi:hypothetical protein CYMTET_43410 [Cymbomonas tetramitiformis]|uniref:Uncharacterized protein n=1 Tax=Cymbomonas tetramitiformis TaxID=36881 RepID=A0AAE0C288_9CHLO|nr:hypothetical protein CYMTET_43413 [Cymbomonas tetramitiformis]KAK3247082.1 hypothetical protein CYMTET_43410 [Cymbomonas tetramitiformis]